MAADRWPRPQRCRRALQGFSGLIVGCFSVHVARAGSTTSSVRKAEISSTSSLFIYCSDFRLGRFPAATEFWLIAALPLLRGEHVKEERASTRNITAAMLLHLRDDFALS